MLQPAAAKAPTSNWLSTYTSLNIYALNN